MKYANVNTITVHFRSSVYRNPMIDAMAEHLSKIFIPIIGGESNE